ncbi:hypothetical protein EIP91_007810 [Steccherinum ochraceum]|uniref:Ubiquitin-like protease family profile domain-containing protein n=1 Tax=Steccherinum ochraceum TaxID=92696 RepID=A0A4R0R3W3_9APHY|nr:hypothetical protein EIP91_007810 [Steccherinum ochraceum]
MLSTIHTSTPSSLPDASTLSNESSTTLAKLYNMRGRLVGGSGSNGSSTSSSSVGPPVAIDLTDSEAEDPADALKSAEWIGCGKVWVEFEMPRSVVKANSRARSAPPSAIDALFPSPHLPVSQFLALLAQTDTTSSHDRGRPYLQNEAPNILTDASNPDEFKACITNLCQPSFYDALPHLQGVPGDLLQRLVALDHKRNLWQATDAWLESIDAFAEDNHTRDLVEECYIRRDVIPWDSHVPCFRKSVSITASRLAVFLSNEWLDDEMIDLGTSFVAHRLGRNARRSKAHNSVYAPKSQTQLDQAISAGQVDVLDVHFNPLHHWVLIRADLRARTLTYIDNAHLSATVPSHVRDLLCWYLQALCPHGNAFVVSPFPETLPLQIDSDSCGVVVLSNLASDYLGLPRWTQDLAAAYRMEWFIRLTDSLTDTPEVSDSGDDELAATSGTGFIQGDVDIVSSLVPFSLDVSSKLCAPPSPSRLGSPSPVQTNVSTPLEPSRQESPHPSPSPSPPSSTYRKPASRSRRRKTKITVSIRVSKRRGYSSSESDSEPELPDAELYSATKRRRAVAPKAGSSWAKQKELNSKATSRDFKPRVAHLESFRAKVLRDDPHAMFKTEDLRAVRCSSCAKWICMRALYDLRRWKDHRKTAACQQRQGTTTKSLLSFFPKAATTHLHSTPSSAPPLIPSIDYPCPRLTRQSSPQIDHYLSRMSTAGGGAPSRATLASQLFPELDVKPTWSSLTPDQQKSALDWPFFWTPRVLQRRG